MDEKTVRVLVADDERPIRRFLNASLSGQYTVLEAATGEETLAVTVSGRPDVIILDLGLPDMDGVEVTRRLREWTQIPIIVVSVRDREEDKIAALDAGADDYLTKPFGAGELMARLRAALRRSALPESEPVYQAGGLLVDLARREVMVNGQTVSADADGIRYPAHSHSACRQSAYPPADSFMQCGAPATKRMRICYG